MSELLLPIGGGGGTGSDELTATKAQVLEGYTAVTKDSDDEAATGTMQNLTAKSTKTYTSSNGTPVLDGYGLSLQTNSDGVKRIMIDSQYGGYIGAWTLFGIGADKLGGASQSNVLSGQTFTSSNGIKLNGTMPKLGGQTITPSSSQQTISCSGKYMTGNIIIKAIPSSYLSPGSWTVFNDGAFSSWLGWAPYQYTSTILNHVSTQTTAAIAKNNTLIKGLFFYLNRLFPTAHLQSIRLIGQSVNTRDTYHDIYVLIGTKVDGGYKTVALKPIVDASYRGDDWKSFDRTIDLTGTTSYGSEIAIGFTGGTTTTNQMKLSKIIFTMK